MKSADALMVIYYVAERRAGVHARLYRRLAPSQEEAIMVQIRSETDSP